MLINYRHNMEGSSGATLKKSSILTIQSAGLAALLAYTVKDIEFASLRIPNGLKFVEPCPESDSLPLQSLLLSDLSQYLTKIAERSE